jgi:hypothetical protein
MVLCRKRLGSWRKLTGKIKLDHITPQLITSIEVQLQTACSAARAPCTSIDDISWAVM